MKTHRCTESLKQQIPIRYREANNRYNEIEGWYLYRRWFDWEYGSESQGIEVVCNISVCPFCGEKLK